MSPHRLAALLALLTLPAAAPAAPPTDNRADPADFLLPNEAAMTPFKDRVPMVFVTRNQPGWAALKSFWNDATEDAADPATGRTVSRKAVKIKVPLGLTTAAARARPRTR